MSLELIIILLMVVTIILVVVTLVVLIGIRQFYWNNYNKHDEFNFDSWEKYRNIGIAEGRYLDKLANLYGLVREPQESDTDLRGRVIEKHGSLCR